MATIFAILTAIFVSALIAGPVLFLHSRRVLTEQKNFERGLKMIPLLIHLPPPSDDTEVGSRDVRDVTEENISKAEILYSIISSTMQKGLKRKFYGQRHLSFEIVGVDGFIHFYVAVPVALVDVVKQAVVSAYPSARLEEVPEHNIFNRVGKISSTLGGELTLKEDYAYPIATYQDIKRDPMQSVLNSLSTLDKEDGAAIQILIRPADPGWSKRASSVASKKRKGEQKRGGAELTFWWVSQVFGALFKPPEDKSGDSDKGSSDRSSTESSLIDSIDNKTRHPGFDTVIRVVTSSNMSQKSESVLRNVVASFALFDAAGRNGFKYVPAQDIESFATSYILRFFPPTHSKNVLNSVELATLFHFPQQEDIPTSQLTRQGSKQVDGPRNMPETGLLLGYNEFRGTRKPVRLSRQDRQRHLYVVGQTGVGKSVFLENVALQDMISGDGFAFIDPHGDTAERLLCMVPKERTEDVIYFSPADMDYPLGLNMFEFNLPEQKDFIIQECINMLYKLYDPQRQGIISPRFERIFTNSALLLMADPGGGTFVDIPKLLLDPTFMKSKLQYVTDQNVLDFWLKEWPASQRSNDAGDMIAWVTSKFGAFLSNEMMRNIIGQTKSSFDLREIMDNKKILLVNLSKGRTGELNSRLLGMIFVMKFQAAAMSRANIPEDQRQDFCLYVDEFQNFSTDSFATIMSEARKYRLSLTVANQFTTQLTDEIRDAVFGNMGTIVSFRIGQNDVDSLARYFQPLFDGDDLLRIPNFNTIVRTLISGVPTQPFSMATIPPLGNPNDELGKALKQLSAAKFGRPRQSVEKEIFMRMRTMNVPVGQQASTSPATYQSQAASATAFNTGGNNSSTLPTQSPSEGSFLDQWLQKRKHTQSAPSAGLGGQEVGSSQQSISNPTNSAKPGGELAEKVIPNQGSIPLKNSSNGPDADHIIMIDRDGKLH